VKLVVFETIGILGAVISCAYARQPISGMVAIAQDGTRISTAWIAVKISRSHRKDKEIVDC